VGLDNWNHSFNLKSLCISDSWYYLWPYFQVYLHRRGVRSSAWTSGFSPHCWTSGNQR